MDQCMKDCRDTAVVTQKACITDINLPICLVVVEKSHQPCPEKSGAACRHSVELLAVIIEVVVEPLVIQPAAATVVAITVHNGLVGVTLWQVRRWRALAKRGKVVVVVPADRKKAKLVDQPKEDNSEGLPACKPPPKRSHQC